MDLKYLFASWTCSYRRNVGYDNQIQVFVVQTKITENPKVIYLVLSTQILRIIYLILLILLLFEYRAVLLPNVKSVILAQGLKLILVEIVVEGL